MSTPSAWTKTTCRSSGTLLSSRYGRILAFVHTAPPPLPPFVSLPLFPLYNAVRFQDSSCHG